MTYKITKSTIDAIARTYAKFYLERPNLNLNSQENADFCEVIDLCLIQVSFAIAIKTDSQMGSPNWWKALYQVINANPPEELKQYLSWANWEN